MRKVEMESFVKRGCVKRDQPLFLCSGRFENF